MSAAATATAAAAAREVTRSNFSAALKEFRHHLDACDFVALAARTTGGAVGGGADGQSWRRVLPFDSPETAYLKFRRAAESYEMLQLAVCPFTVRNNRVTAFPYNFYLFPRDEHNIGMPSYSFACQPSYLEAMTRDGFDFSLCINDGLSYLSRVQESVAKVGNPSVQASTSTSATQSVADRVFVKRIKSRIEHWEKACKEPNTADGSLVNSLRRLILAGEKYGSRPCLSIDVCSDRQVQLVLQIANKICDDAVPLVAQNQGGNPSVVRLILSSSKEDKELLLTEIQQAEEEQNLKLRGFREVVDLISASQKPLVSYNSLRDFTFMHSKFVGPLPPSLQEFIYSLRMVFSHVIDISHLWKQIGPLKKATNIQAALSYLQRRFCVPLEVEVPSEAVGDSKIKVEQNVLRITRLFSKLYVLLKINSGCQSVPTEGYKSIEEFSNNFLPSCTVLQEYDHRDDTSEMDTIRKIRTDNLIFLWGFDEASSMDLRLRLKELHMLFSEEFELKLVDRTCAILLFFHSGAALQLLQEVSSKSNASADFLSHGFRAAGFDAYKKACSLGLWDMDLAEALESITSESVDVLSSPDEDTSETYWDSDLLILDVNEFLGS